MVTKMDRRLAGLSNLLSHCSRLVVIKSVISAMPNFIMCALKVHYTHLDHIEKYIRTFLWHGNDIEKSCKGKCLVKCDKVCMTKEAGGLGMINLREHNKALMIKNLFKFYNHQNIPWVNLLWRAYYNEGLSNISRRNRGSFWWKNCLSHLQVFKQLTYCTPQSGNTIMLWSDKWTDTMLLESLPQLYSFTNNKDITLQQVKYLNLDELYDHF
jgi:hypothetical protein